MRKTRMDLGVAYDASRFSKALLASLVHHRIMCRREPEDKFLLTADFGSHEQRIEFDCIRSVEFFEHADIHGRSIRVVLGVMLVDWFQDAILVIYPDDKPVTGTIVFYPYTLSARLKGELPDVNFLPQAVALVLHRDNINVWWDDGCLRRGLRQSFKIHNIPEGGGDALLKKMCELGITRLSANCDSWHTAMNRQQFEEKFHTRLPDIPG